MGNENTTVSQRIIHGMPSEDTINISGIWNTVVRENCPDVKSIKIDWVRWVRFEMESPRGCLPMIIPSFRTKLKTRHCGDLGIWLLGLQTTHVHEVNKVTYPQISVTISKLLILHRVPTELAQSDHTWGISWRNKWRMDRCVRLALEPYRWRNRARPSRMCPKNHSMGH